eukprot:CAMPEP_0119526166 /NCGR_PEP_ID=MMETSP1344-20130328/40822_1 /TAXON_ID=236787 /ORGANISM="Florenciella parvula, Strain CCMP2471" /LENGTH=73 /DNA_ID=CAMNT_0007565093 /DNA_START=105 /DNA_END=323 /DNA_ORIENTATION=-
MLTNTSNRNLSPARYMALMTSWMDNFRRFETQLDSHLRGGATRTASATSATGATRATTSTTIGYDTEHGLMGW